jgi:hypothetical protein
MVPFNVMVRPTTVLLLIALTYTMVAVPVDRRLEVLALTALTSLGGGELFVTILHLMRQRAFRIWRPTALLSAAGFVGSASYVSSQSTVLFIISMLLLVSGVLAARDTAGASMDL